MSAWDSPALGEDWFGKRNKKPRGSSPEDYLSSERRSSAAGEVAGEAREGGRESSQGAVAALVDDTPPQTGEPELKPGMPQGDPGQPSTYEGEGNYKYQVADDGRIYILQSGYKGQTRDYSSAPREVRKGTGAYNAIVAELNQKHQLGLKPAPVVSRPAAPPATPPAPGDKNAKPQDAAKPPATPPSPPAAPAPAPPPAIPAQEQDADPIAAYLLDRPEVNDYLQSFGVEDGGTYPERASLPSPELLFYQQHPDQFQNARSAIARTGRASPQSVEDLAAMLSDPAVKQAVKSEIVRRGYGSVYAQ